MYTSIILYIFTSVLEANSHEYLNCTNVILGPQGRDQLIYDSTLLIWFQLGSGIPSLSL